jgi:hypothetical protein
MYGVVYDLTLNVANTESCGTGGGARQVAVRLGSFGCAATRCYDGWAALISGSEQDGTKREAVYHHIVTTPESRVYELGRFAIAPCYKKVLRLVMMIPGLSSIPQALFFTTVPDSEPGAAYPSLCGH